MSKYKYFTLKLRTAHYISYKYLIVPYTWIPVVILESKYASMPSMIRRENEKDMKLDKK